MADVMIDVAFDPPRWLSERGKSYWLSAEGEDDIQLPMSLTKLAFESSPEGEVVVGALIPRYIAEDRGLVSSWETNDERDEMTRADWYLLGMIMAMLIRGDNIDDAVWEGRKLAARILDQYLFEGVNDG